jgi:hypothetical protein
MDSDKIIVGVVEEFNLVSDFRANLMATDSLAGLNLYKLRESQFTIRTVTKTIKITGPVKIVVQNYYKVGAIDLHPKSQASCRPDRRGRRDTTRPWRRREITQGLCAF